MEWNCGNDIAEIGGNFFFFFAIGLWQCHCRKWEEKKIVCDNGIVEIEGIHFWQLWQWHCRNRGVKKKFWNCEKWNGIRQCHCHNSIPIIIIFLFLFF